MNLPSDTYTYTVTAVFRSWTATSDPSGPVTVPVPQLTSLILAPSTPTPTAGTAFTVGITAYDQYGEIDTAYTGPECLTFSGPDISVDSNSPKYPVPGGCSSGSEVTFDNGVSTGTNSALMTLFDAESVTLTATDNPTNVDGTTDLMVSSAPISTFEVANPGPQTAGIGFDDTITALDGYGNLVTGYTGPHTLVFSGPSNSPNSDTPSYPSPVNFNLGVGDATGIILVDAQTTALTATESPIMGTSTDFVVSAGSADHYVVAAPPTATVAVPFTVTITAYDVDGNLAVGYDGTAELASSIGNVLPTSITLVNGTVSFSATLDTAGDQTITAEDSVTTSISGVSGIIDVSGTYTVTYQLGEGVTGTPPSDSNSPYGANALVTVLGNSDLAAPGQIFSGWSTQAAGAGTFYLPGAQFTITANTSLYAVFVPATATYTVTYQLGEGVTGTPPSDSNSPYGANALVTVLGNSDLAAPGQIFSGWSTQAAGAGTFYLPGAQFTITANTSLYAVFVPATATYTVTYQLGEGVTGTPPSDSNSPYGANALVTVLGNSDLAAPGQIFSGWSTQAAGAGTFYLPGAQFTITANTSLYAVFVPATATYTVTYQLGEGVTGTPPSDSNSPYGANALVTVLGNSDLAAPGQIFSGWSTQAAGAGTFYLPGAQFTITANTSLYAVFVPATATYTVTYQLGEGVTGTPPSDSNSPYGANALVTVLGNSDLAAPGQIFSGWSTQAAGAGTFYLPGAQFTITANTSLYAVFVPATATYTVTYQLGEGVTGTPPSDSNSPYGANALVTVLGNSDLAAPGQIFSGWSTQAAGAGTFYLPGAQFTITANTSLYAVFVPATATYTVTYQLGEGVTGTPPSDSNSPYGANALVTVLGNSDLAAPGQIFSGWSTQAAGAGTFYLPGAQFTITANTSLYAVFVPATATYTVTYQLGEGVTGTPPSDSNSPYGANALVTVLGNSDLAAPGQIFSGWSTQAAGAGTFYLPGAQFTITANTSLYAVFIKNLVITTTSLAGATAGQNNYSQILQGSGGTPPYTWSISAGILPKGLSLNPSTGQISGNVSAWAVTETFTVELTDHKGASTTKQFTITVTTPLVITTTSLAGATAGQNNYSQILQGSGGTPPYTWSISAGILPKGLSLNPSTGQISGNVSVWAVTETFTVELTDHKGASTTKQFTITVISKPVFTCGNSDHGSRGHSYRFQFTTWGDPDQTFRESGKLPEGLSFDDQTGLIWGTPEGGEGGDYSFTITAVNSWGSSSMTFNLRIS